MRHEAIYATHPNVASVSDLDGCYDKDGNKVEIDESKVAEEVKRLKAEFDANQYQRDRIKEYPSIQELVVALYDADDKAEIDKKRAEIKKKYPKPE